MEALPGAVKVQEDSWQSIRGRKWPNEPPTTKRPKRRSQSPIQRRSELEAALTIGGRPTARAALRTTPAGVICAGLAVAAIILSSAAVVRIVGRR